MSRQKLLLFIKGFFMGTADIVPGVSGGTVALIAGIYDELIQTISSVNKEKILSLFKLNFKKIYKDFNLSFLIPLGLGIASAILIMARVMSFLMLNYSVYTWSLFFGLIISSIIFLAKKIPNIKSYKSLLALSLGTIVGYATVSLVPVTTPESSLIIFLSGMVAICAMILPGISGSFILLILGKYVFVTTAIKNPFLWDNIVIIFTFSCGCLLGILSFSKFLNFCLTKYYQLTMSVLVGFMIGSLKKIWPWKEVIESKIVRGKVHVLQDSNILPNSLNSEVIFALILMLLGFVIIQLIERFEKS